MLKRMAFECSLEDKMAYETTAKAFDRKLSNTERIHFYTNWASSYEEDYKGRYKGHVIAADSVSRYLPNMEAKILDIGAGTGLVGQRLTDIGYMSIDALEPSEGMLQIAKEKSIYRKLIHEFMTKEKLPIEEGYYDCAVTAGGFGNGHIPYDALKEIIRIVRTDGIIIIVMREEYLNLEDYKDKLEPLMDKLKKEGKWKKLQRTIIDKYFIEKSGILFVFKALQPF